MAIEALSTITAPLRAGRWQGRRTGMRLTFLGATRTVTGSRYLVEAAGRTLLVDCGLFQGFKELRLRNWAAFPVPPRAIDAIVLTHAHLDHSGYLPLLVRQGFRGRIYCTPPTRDLCGLLLPDSGHLQEEDARRANRHRFSKHDPARPLYTADDAEAALARFRPVPFGQDLPLGQGLRVRFERNGHILGAAWVLLTAENRTVLFSGDIGRPHDPVMKPPITPAAAGCSTTSNTSRPIRGTRSSSPASRRAGRAVTACCAARRR